MGAHFVRVLLSFLVLVTFGEWRPAEAHAPARVTPLSVCFAKAMPGSTPAGVLAGQVRMDCSRDQYRVGPGDYWVLSQRFSAGNPQEQHLRLRMASLWQNGVTVYALYADGHIVRIYASSRGLTRHIELGAIVDFQLPTSAVPLNRILWRIDGSANARGIVLDARVTTPQRHDQFNLTMAALYGGFGGLALALLVYNLALWGAMRQRFQVSYCLMLVALAAYALSSSGALAWLMPWIDNNDRLRFNYLTLALTAACVIDFARAFFEPRVFAGWMGRLATAAVMALIASGFGFLGVSQFNMRLADTLYSYAFLIAIGIAPLVFWRAWRQRSEYRWLFAIAWTIPCLLAAWRLIALLHVVEPNFLLDNSTIISMTIEALVSSLAIAYRVQLLRSERDDARAGEVVARQLADIDPLTGLLNRRAFLADAIGRVGQQVLHIVDIDHFKRINETLGHDGGDEVLRLFARVLRSVTPANGLVARLGGEEFAVLTDLASTVDPERLLAKLRAARMPFDLSVTSSIGSCAGPLDSEIDWKKLYHCADRALFDAKAAGRDRVRCAKALASAA